MRVSSILGLLTLCVVVGCSTPTTADLEGQWGGAHVNLILADTGGTVEFDCGRGTIDPGWSLTPEGRFAAIGAFYQEAGPEPIAGRPPQPARYEGTLLNSRLTLTVSLTDAGTRLGPFVLERGRTVQLIKCL
jgi:hypothetical protein